MKCSWNDQTEWLETDGLGGFASGTAGGIRTRRYHGLLMAATTPPTGRFMLVNGVEALVTTSAGTFPLSTQRYDGQILSPEGHKLIEAFDTQPWPTWRFHLPDGTKIEQEFFLSHGQPIASMSWRLIESAGPVTLTLRPFLSGRDYHALHHENGVFDFSAAIKGCNVAWRPYKSVPTISTYSNGRYTHQPVWYRRFFYQEESLRGFDAGEDLASPGTFTFSLADEAVLVFTAAGGQPLNLPARNPRQLIESLRDVELKRRNAFPSSLQRAADQYIVRRGDGKSIIAGYPWFVDWGRDTFISLRGLCLATGRLDDAKHILLAWSRHVSLGMLPNRFPDSGEQPEYNSVDASLWYVIAVCEFLRLADRRPFHVSDFTRSALLGAVDQILTGYRAGTRHGIRMDNDGLLLSGVPGQQLTWMDARAAGREITPRHGKPVEVQCLWINALHLAGQVDLAGRAIASFRRKFWTGSHLLDVADPDDPTFRPNQIYAVGGLPMTIVEAEQARAIVDSVEKRLLTPIGLRSIDPADRAYIPRYTGGPNERDAAYHQGTVWPFLIGPFVEAWLRVHGDRAEARRRFVQPLLKHLDEAGLGHVSEIADADAPHQPRGCPFQAWSLGELLRLELQVLQPKELSCATSLSFSS